MADGIRVTKRIFGILLLCMGLVMGLMLLFSARDSINDSEEFKYEQVEELTNGWRVDGQAIDALPYMSFWTKGEEIRFTNTLPENLTDDMTLMMQVNYAFHDFYVDGEKIFSFGPDGDKEPEDFCGNFRAVVDLKAEYSGKELTIVTTPNYSRNFLVDHIYIGRKDSLLRVIAKRDVWRMVLINIFYVISFLTLLIGCYNYKASGIRKQTRILYLSGFLFAVANWLMCSSDIPQFFTDKNVAVAFVSFLSLIFIPLFFCGFCKNNFLRQRKWFELGQYAGFVLVLVNCLGFLTGLADPMDLLLLTHSYMLIVVVLHIYCAAVNAKKDRMARLFLINAILFGFFAIITLLAFYLAPGDGTDAKCACLTLLIFSVGLLYIVGKKELEISREMLKNVIYKKMAYTDAMTELGNRMALEQKVEAIMEKATDGTLITYVMCDLNGLKKTNDTYGHEAGDAMIIDAARCIREVVPREAGCYRLGGDEFSILLVDSPVEAEEIIETIQKGLDEYNKESDIKLSIAMGASTVVFRQNQPNFFVELFKEADDKMYRMKRAQHGERD